MISSCSTHSPAFSDWLGQANSQALEGFWGKDNKVSMSCKWLNKLKVPNKSSDAEGKNPSAAYLATCGSRKPWPTCLSLQKPGLL